MKANRYKITLSFLLVIVAALAPACLASSAEKDNIARYFTVAINLFSFNPAQPIESYHQYGSGNAGERGTVGLSCYDNGRMFQVNTTPKNSREVNVTLVPDKRDSTTPANSFKVDLSDMKPQSLDLAKNEDGCIFRLTLVPRIEIVDNRPKKADNSSFQLDRWVLAEALVIFNDSFYAGTLGCSGGPLAYVDYPGIAKVEFALEPFRGAESIGRLKDGRLHIQNKDGQTLDIYGVKNGAYETQLPGGPYEVWVRWQNLPKATDQPIPTKEEWIKMVKTKFAEMGQTPPTDEEFNSNYEKLKYEKHGALSSGVGPIKGADKISK